MAVTHDNDVNHYLYDVCAVIHWNKRTLYHSISFDWEGQGQETEGVKGHRHPRALRAIDSASEQPVEDVDDDGVVSLPVVLPALYGDLLVGSTVRFLDLNIPGKPTNHIAFRQQVERKNLEHCSGSCNVIASLRMSRGKHHVMNLLMFCL